MEKLMPRVKHGRYLLLPTTDKTRGHGTHSLPAIWGKYLAEFLQGTDAGDVSVEAEQRGGAARLRAADASSRASVSLNQS